MPAAECTVPTDAPTQLEEPQPDPFARTRKRVFFCFVGTIVLGFVMAGWYVQDRILAADTAHSTVSDPALPTPVAAPVTLAKTVPVVKGPELYLQVPSLGTNQDARFVKRIKADGFEARVDTDSAAGNRVLIGPYSAQGELQHAQSRLAASGIITTEF